MTLEDFLLTRIAEDAEDAAAVHEWGCAGYGAVPFPCDCRIPARMLAECQAKRRIVELPDPDSVGSFVDGWWSAQYKVLCILAMPYADHPDYDPKWESPW